MEALRTRAAEAAVWWMSVNNFTGMRYGRPWRDRLRYLKYLLKRRRPWGGVRALAHLRHFAQSEHAREFLADHGIASQMLSDPIPVYTAPEYVASLPPRLAGAERADTILYNPTKGAADHGSADVRLSAVALPGRFAGWTASSWRSLPGRQAVHRLRAPSGQGPPAA